MNECSQCLRSQIEIEELKKEVDYWYKKSKESPVPLITIPYDRYLELLSYEQQIKTPKAPEYFTLPPYLTPTAPTVAMYMVQVPATYYSTTNSSSNTTKTNKGE